MDQVSRRRHDEPPEQPQDDEDDNDRFERIPGHKENPLPATPLISFRFPPRDPKGDCNSELPVGKRKLARPPWEPRRIELVEPHSICLALAHHHQDAWRSGALPGGLMHTLNLSPSSL